MSGSLEKVLGIVQRLIWLAFLLITGYLFLLSIFSSCMVATPPGEETKTFYLHDNFLVHIFVIAAFVAGGSLLYHRGNVVGRIAKKKAAILGVYFLACVIFVVVTQLYPISDQRDLIKAAEAMQRGDFSDFLQGGYLYNNPHQKGILMYIYLFSVIFGERAYLVIQIVNAVWTVAGFWLLGAVTEQMWPEKAEDELGGKVILASVFCLPSFFYVTYIYGNVPGMCLALAGIWLEIAFLKKGKISLLAGSVLCIGLAVILKMNCLIMGIGMLLCAVSMFRKKRFTGRTAVYCLLLLLVFLYGNRLVDTAVERAFHVPESDGIPMNSLIAMGLQDNVAGPGWWNSYSVDNFKESGYDSQLAAQNANRRIVRQIEILTENPMSGVRFFIKKFASGWNNPTYQGLGILVGREGNYKEEWGKLAQTEDGALLHNYMNLYHSVILAGCLLYLLYYRKKLNELNLLFPVIIMGGCVFHMFWEMKSVYILPYFIMLLPLSVIGYMEGFRALNSRWDEMKAGRASKISTKRKLMIICGGVLLVLLLSQAERTELFTKTIGLNENQEAYEEIYYS